MRPNCKQCISYAMCINILKDNLDIDNDNDFTHGIRVLDIRKRCSTYNNFTVKFSLSDIRKHLVDILNLNIDHNKLYIWFM